MKVLVACECSGIVRKEFRKIGHEAFSCDLLPADDRGEHVIVKDNDDLFKVINTNNWDLLIVHPPCTYLSSSGMHWTTRGLRDKQLTIDALDFAKKLLNVNINKICLENPIGILSTQIRKPDQIIQPYEFGNNASKATCLWLKNLPLLRPTKYIPPRDIIKGNKIYKRWSNQTDSGQNRLGPSETRAKERATTYLGIAQAMADQWGNLLF